MTENIKPDFKDCEKYQISLLFKVYNKECNHRKISYTTSEKRKDKLQSWIVMDGIELSYAHNEVHNKMEVVFMCNRDTTDFGDTTLYFKTFKECLKVWEMSAEEVDKYYKVN